MKNDWIENEIIIIISKIVQDKAKTEHEWKRDGEPLPAAAAYLT